MESIVSVVNMIFKDVSPAKILSGAVDYACFPKEEFVALYNHKNDAMSGNDVEQLYYYLLTMLKDQTSKNDVSVFEERGFSILDLLKGCTDRILEQIQGEPVCKYRRLLAWRMITSKLCEDMFTTAFLAFQDNEKLWSKRTNYDWRTVIGHNNYELNNMLKKGVVENHYHLKGSAPYFAITWLNLMNDVSNTHFIRCLQEFDSHRLVKDIHPAWSGHEPSYIEMHLQAALIRCFLFCRLRKIPFDVFGSYPMKMTEVENRFAWPDERQKRGDDFKNALSVFEEAGMCRVGFKKFMDILLLEKNENRDDFSETSQFWRDITDIISAEHTVEITDLKEQYKRNKGITLKDISMMFLKKVSVVYIRRNLVTSLIKVEDQEQFIRQKEFELVNQFLSDPERIFEIRKELQSFINDFHKCRKSRPENETEDVELIYDYIGSYSLGNQKKVFQNVNRTERWFLYSLFMKLHSGDREFTPLGNMFYAYLVIKEKIRSELVQVNGKTGFDNFLKFQDRKEYFIENTRYEKVYSYIALADTLHYQRDALIRLEARITPKDTALDNRNVIKNLTGALTKIEGAKDKVFYVFHFVKEPDRELTSNKLQCRSYKKRREVRKKAIAIENFRQRYPEQAALVYGIDACSPEIGCRPEVFAQAFTYLRGMQEGASRHEDKVPRLGISYHVGEDFLDIVDGLRAIDEAVHFLHMDSGDRLGHALALGVNPTEWYDFKGRRVLMTKQDHLDNIVWIYMKIRKYQILHSESMLQELYRDYTHCFQEIYGLMECDINLYYDAWKLRGDNPELYLVDEDRINTDIEWNYFARNECYPENKKIREQEVCRELYIRYHYDVKVKKRGAEVVECKVSRELMEVIEQIQKGLQKEIAKMGISIEANPSSNYMIGTFDRYDQHPIRNFYNKGLTVNYEEIMNNPQIDVTINTDDQAIFNTCLENEYAYIALAMEKIRDSKGEPVYKRSMIYEWLNNIRRNSQKVCFWNNGSFTEFDNSNEKEGDQDDEG